MRAHVRSGWAGPRAAVRPPSCRARAAVRVRVSRTGNRLGRSRYCDRQREGGARVPGSSTHTRGRQDDGTAQDPLGRSSTNLCKEKRLLSFSLVAVHLAREHPDVRLTEPQRQADGYGQTSRIFPDGLSPLGVREEDQSTQISNSGSPWAYAPENHWEETVQEISGFQSSCSVRGRI